MAAVGSNSNFKVIIAGGGIGGLTLASALEKAGVDYVLLEKRNIAPRLGTSITSLPCTTIVSGATDPCLLVQRPGFAMAISLRCTPKPS